MTFRVRIDPVALRQIDEFAAYLRNYDEDFAVSLLPPCHQRPTELPVAEGRKQKPLSRSRSLHQIEAPSCWHASIPSACPHRGVRAKAPTLQESWRPPRQTLHSRHDFPLRRSCRRRPAPPPFSWIKRYSLGTVSFH